MQTTRSAVAGVIAVLVIQNILIFWRHYFLGYSFPWDFLATYHAVPYYWIEAVRHGASVAWVPFQGMGYPLYLNPQSGLFYPPLWLVVALNQAYSIATATTLQALHVGFGAAGAAVAARLMGMRWSTSLFAGVCYQGFGAFYSNSEHVDIVRAYALLPWLAAPVFAHWTPASRLLKFSVVIQPILVYALWTGGYFGVCVAQLFVLGTITLVRIVVERDARRIGILLLLLQGVGCLLAGIFLLPIALSTSEIERGTFIVPYDYLAAHDVFALVYDINNAVFGHDLSMRSMFVGLPVMALLFMGLPGVRRWDPWVVVAAVLALSMVVGLLHPVLARLIRPIGLSRFVLGDYRGLIGMSLILLSAQCLEQFRPGPKNLPWLLAFVAWLVLGVFVLKLFPAHILQVVGTAGALLCLCAFLWFVPARFPKIFVPLLILLVVLDWGRAQWNQAYFNFPQAGTHVDVGAQGLKASHPALIARMQPSDGCRPARLPLHQEEYTKTPWRGYYTGDYMMEDYSGPMQFSRQIKILHDPPLHEFARLPWKAVTETPEGEPLAQREQTPALTCRGYGLNRIEYEVDAPEAQAIVENEMFWNGWRADVLDAQGNIRETLKPYEVNGFRAWHLPQGRYRLIATYVAPYRTWGLMSSGAGLLLWLLLGLVTYRPVRAALAQE